MSVLNTAILIFDQVEVLDFAGPFEVFSRTRLEPGVESRRNEDSAPFRVFTVAPGPETLRAVGGLQVTPDFSYDSVPKIDLLVVPGGFGVRALLESPPTLDWVRQVAAQAKHVVSVCTGSLLLARVGLLKNKKATTHWCAYDSLRGIDSTIQVEEGARVVHDGIVTSAGVAAGIDMAFSVVEIICGKEVADETARYIEYPRGISASART